jgi:hypothetical protein
MNVILRSRGHSNNTRRLSSRKIKVDAYFNGTVVFRILLSFNEKDITSAPFQYPQRNNIELYFNDMINLMDCSRQDFRRGHLRTFLHKLHDNEIRE